MHGSLSSALTELGGGEKENRYQFDACGAGLCLRQMRPLKQTRRKLLHEKREREQKLPELRENDLPKQIAVREVD